MTQIVINIRNKKDLPFLMKISKSMGWIVSGEEVPNETTLAAMREAESGVELEEFDIEGLHRMAAGL